MRKKAKINFKIKIENFKKKIKKFFGKIKKTETAAAAAEKISPPPPPPRFGWETKFSQNFWA